MAETHRLVLLDDNYGELTEEVPLEFRLSYRGLLRATQRDAPPGSPVKAAHWQLKHDMRLAFHRQIKTVWHTHPLLSHKKDETGSILNVGTLASDYRVPPWSFVPLVTFELQVLCGLDIVLLRLDHPGSSVWSGDIDNRIKTVIDALEVPDAHGGYAADIPLDPNANPLFCLLASDRLLTSVSVETDRLLDAPDGADQSYAQVQIRVRIKPENVTMPNLGL